jgi:hypothetical protein
MEFMGQRHVIQQLQATQLTKVCTIIAQTELFIAQVFTAIQTYAIAVYLLLNIELILEVAIMYTMG